MPKMPAKPMTGPKPAPKAEVPKTAAPKTAAPKAAAPKTAAPKTIAPKTVAGKIGAPVVPAAKAAPKVIAPRAVAARPAAPAAARSAPKAAPKPEIEAATPVVPLPVAAASAKPAAAASFDLPFVPGDMLPKAMQDFATSGLSQAREAYRKARTSAETLNHSVGASGEAAASGMQEFSRTLIDAVQANTDATLGFIKAMSGVRSVSEAVELQARHARAQFETVTEQAKALAGIANRTFVLTAKPVREALDTSLKTAS